PFNAVSGNLLWGQHDSPPVQGAFPTRAWPAGLIVRDRHVLRLDPAAPPAEYQVVTGLYDPLTGARMPVPGHADNAVSLLSFSIP
ncbi:MAG TPA: hypothetical protein VJ754_05765, partial [Anaerolineae bacterium]|nr:hypothetical protein [Anaerolineae bacterium]